MQPLQDRLKNLLLLHEQVGPVPSRLVGPADVVQVVLQRGMKELCLGLFQSEVHHRVFGLRFEVVPAVPVPTSGGLQSVTSQSRSEPNHLVRSDPFSRNSASWTCTARRPCPK
jgi:hypothetical protein